MLAIEQDRERPHEEVAVGSRWFAWGYHWDIQRQRDAHGVREVLMSLGPRKLKAWVPAWRVQRYGVLSKAPREEEP